MIANNGSFPCLSPAACFNAVRAAFVVFFCGDFSQCGKLRQVPAAQKIARRRCRIGDACSANHDIHKNLWISVWTFDELVARCP